jgi:Bacterial lectin
MSQLRRVVIALACTLPLSAGSFNFSNFSSTAGLNLVGNATNPSNTIQLTAASFDQAGAVWDTTLWNVLGGFTTTFNYSVTGGTSPEADGIAFAIQDDPNGTTALGGEGNDLGAGGLNNSVAVALRNYVFNDAEVDSCGAGNTQQIGSCVVGSSAPETLTGTHTVQITYLPGTLTVFLDGSQILSDSINLSTAINLSGGNLAYIGLTGGTGSLDSAQTINSWSFSTTVPEPATWSLVGLALPLLFLRRRKQTR